MLAIVPVRYSSPVDYDITLAGNFGEPRPYHFHGGLDIKTDNVEGKHVRSIADGYVSRITVGLYGFGNAVYVTHPEGYTSVYAHLKRFSPRLEKHITRPNGRDTIDIHFTPLDFPVSQGQLIAVSGNTGHSTGPHLHLEIHDTQTWNMLDPLDFIGHLISDSVAPRAHSIMACPLAGHGTFCGTSSIQTFPCDRINADSTETSTLLTAWGRVGFALWADDYMQGVHNYYGIRQTILLVDGHEVFRSDVDRIPTNDNRQVNAWGDFSHWRRNRTWYMRSFILPGVTLPMLHADSNRGYVDFHEERPYRLEYYLRDYFGNESHYAFTVVGKRENIAMAKATALPYCCGSAVFCDRLTTVSMPGMTLVIPPRMVAVNTAIHTTAEKGLLSPRYCFSSEPLPLFGCGELSIALRQEVADPSLLYIECDGHDIGGRYSNGWISTPIRELSAHYEIKQRTKAN